MRQIIPFSLILLMVIAAGCSPVQRCYKDADCDLPMVCKADGTCDYKCYTDTDCGEGFTCQMHTCLIQGANGIQCPEGMAPIMNAYCMDIYEASKPDATKTSEGSDVSKATSRPNVMPWKVGTDNDVAAEACKAAGKRLCTPSEWEFACHGANNTVYGYGDSYDPQICNGIDTYGLSGFHLTPTGSFPDCNNGWGVYDLNGNVWEHTAGGTGKTVRGGAFNCSDSKAYHKCSYIPTNWTPSALGFRCCSDGIDGEINPETGINDSSNTQNPEGNGGECVDDPNNPSGGETPENPNDNPSGGETPEIPDDNPSGGETPEIPDDNPPGGETPENPDAPCPEDMALVTVGELSFCMDRYEAAHEDATETSEGMSSTPVSKAGVQPWMRPTYQEAVAACDSVGKHLCRTDEWYAGCAGTENLHYSYGNEYQPTTCNGIDAFCNCDSDTCEEQAVCPYKMCVYSCGANFHVTPTGTFENCVNADGIHDLNGNIWEFVDDGTDIPKVKGGAFNCSNSEKLHRCDYETRHESVISYGFRCCKAPESDKAPKKKRLATP